MNSLEVGSRLEELAAQYLQQKDLIVIHRNFYCKLGEIDLILRDQECLVFTEVRYRANTNFGSAAESVTHAKQQKIISAAQVFISNHPWAQNATCRFDVVAISGTITTYNIDWIKDAFDA